MEQFPHFPGIFYKRLSHNSYLLSLKPLAVFRIRDVEGGEAGASWNERRHELSMNS